MAQKLFVLLALLLAFSGWMLYCLLRTQVIQGEEWRNRAKNHEESIKVDPARRGNIYSSDNKLLATTVPVCDLCLDLGEWPKLDSKGNKMRDKDGNVILENNITNDSAFRANLPEVCRILHEQFPAKSVEYYYNRIMVEYNKPKPSRCLYVQRRVPLSKWQAIREMPGWRRIVVAETSEGSVTQMVRSHIYGNMGESTIGLHYNLNGGGYTGLEGYYDTVLSGQDGKYYCRRLTRGVWIPEDGSDEDSVITQPRIDGRSIRATIDTRYQDIAEDALRKTMNQFGGKRGCAILMEVKTGYVLACCNLTRDTAGELAERIWDHVSVSDHYEPGSTFKTVSMMTMLSDRKNHLDTSMRVQAGGQRMFGNQLINDGHGYNTDTASLPTVLARSSNVGMCSLAWKYYHDRRDDLRQGMLNLFPFGKMGVDLAVTETPTTIKKFDCLRDFLNLSYGYKSVVTPMQLVTFYNAIANDGCMVKPLFCKEIMDGRKHSVVEPVVLNPHAFSPELAKQMREMLVGVVDHGTGSNIHNTIYGIAGKTGTTENVHNRAEKNSSFVGFFPADNPRYTCLALVEVTSSTGRVVAAPVFKQIADCVMALDSELGSVRLQDSVRVAHPVVAKGNASQMDEVHRILGLPYSVIDSVHSVSGWIIFDGDQQCYQHYVVPTTKVPDCTGMTVRDAMKLLRGMGLKVRFTGQGKVVSQTPKGRTDLVKGSTVVLELKP